MYWWMITRLGDSSILMPTALFVGMWLVAVRSWRLAWLWYVWFGIAMSIVVVSKLAFIGWGVGVESLDFTGFSGHAARAAAVFPVLFYLGLKKAPRRICSWPVGLGVLLAAVITISRVKVQAHSISEATSGFVLGAVSSLSWIQAAGKFALATKRHWLLAPCLLLLFATPYIKPAPAQQWITSVALYLSGREQPFDRAIWHRSVR